MTVIPPGDYLQSHVPTIFAEEVPNSQHGSSPPPDRSGGLVISKATLSAISLLFIGVLIAGTAFLYFRLKAVDASTAALQNSLKLATEENVKLKAQNATFEESLQKYARIEQLTKDAQVLRDKIQADVVLKPTFPAKRLVNLDPPAWRGKVEDDLDKYRAGLKQLSEDVIQWADKKVVVIDRTLPGGTIRPAPIQPSGTN